MDALQRQRRAGEDDSAPRKARRTAEASAAAAAATALPCAADADDELEVREAPSILFCTDVEHDKASGEFLLYAVSHDSKRTFLLRVTDFAPFVYCRAPVADNGAAPSPAQLAALAAAIAARYGEGVAVDLQVCSKVPLMWYRPAAAPVASADNDGGQCMLKVTTKGARFERFQAALRRVVEDEDALGAIGLTWPHYEVR